MTKARTILITGAAKRLGRAVALDYAARGGRIAVHFRNSEKDAQETVAAIEALGAEAKAFRADLTDSAAGQQLVLDVADYLGPIQSVVTCAAVYRKTPWLESNEADWDFHMNANAKSIFLLLRAATPKMADGGSVVTIGDWAGLRAYRDFLPYCVSKASLIALTKALAMELAPKIRVNCVCPGTVLPPSSASPEALQAIAEQTPLGRIGHPKDIVGAVRYLNEETDFATGTVLAVDGGRLVANGQAY